MLTTNRTAVKRLAIGFHGTAMGLDTPPLLGNRELLW